ncbi:hypothetical protein PG5_46350 [Pseudomonas sp. G5(2012)]|nr:hypothetical protein PG5_46350 [Pseudomonas sp. G5(2012)]
MGRLQNVYGCVHGDLLRLFGSDSSHAPRGNSSMDALRPGLGRRASRAAFPRRARELSLQG